MLQRSWPKSCSAAHTPHPEEQPPHVRRAVMGHLCYEYLVHAKRLFLLYSPGRGSPRELFLNLKSASKKEGRDLNSCCVSASLVD